MKHKPLVKIGLLLILLMSAFQLSGQQNNQDHDTTYYVTYPDKFVGRVYFSRKFTGFNAEFKEETDLLLRYKPNTTRNLGIGGTYKWLTLNLAYGFDFLNSSEKEGKTRYLDLQSHIYTGAYNIDLYGQFYKGYFLDNYTAEDGGVYVRPDIRANELGISVQRVLNHQKFSFRAAFQNTDYQKQSAGSWIVGLSTFYGWIKADSSIAPEYLSNNLPEYSRLNFFKIGPQGGYAYTWVFKKHYYVSGSVVVSVSGGVYKLTAKEQSENEFYLSVDGGFRFGLGYNSERLNIGGFYVLQRVHYNQNFYNRIYTGNIRFILAYRLNWQPPLPFE